MHDVGEDDGRLFIVMELLEGQGIAARDSEGASLPLEDKLSIMGSGEQVYFKSTHGVNSLNPLWVYPVRLW